MPAHPATAGRKAGPVCPRLPWGSKKCFPGGASENGPRFNRHQGTGRLFPAVFRKNVTAGAPFFYHAPFCCQVKMGRGSSGRRSGPPHRSASRQVRSGFLIFTKPAEKRRALSVICSPGCQLSGWQGWRLCPALRARTDIRVPLELKLRHVDGTPRAYGHTQCSQMEPPVRARHSARVRTYAYSVKNYGEACRQFPRSEPFSSGCFRGFALHAGAIKKPASGRMFRDAGWEKSVL